MQAAGKVVVEFHLAILQCTCDEMLLSVGLDGQLRQVLRTRPLEGAERTILSLMIIVTEER